MGLSGLCFFTIKFVIVVIYAVLPQELTELCNVNQQLEEANYPRCGIANVYFVYACAHQYMSCDSSY